MGDMAQDMAHMDTTASTREMLSLPTDTPATDMLDMATDMVSATAMAMVSDMVLTLMPPDTEDTDTTASTREMLSLPTDMPVMVDTDTHMAPDMADMVTHMPQLTAMLVMVMATAMVVTTKSNPSKPFQNCDPFPTSCHSSMILGTLSPKRHRNKSGTTNLLI